MPIFTNFNLKKESKKYNDKQEALRKSFVERVKGYITAEKFAVQDSEVAIEAFTKERDESKANIVEAIALLDKETGVERG